MMASAGFGIMEALGSSAIVATTHQVTSEVAFVLGRLLTAELAKGRDLHTALAASQKRLREMLAAEVVNMLDPLKDNVPECADLLDKMRQGDPERNAFPNVCDTEPFYILGLPTSSSRLEG